MRHRIPPPSFPLEPVHGLLDRGVYKARWMGHNGEWVFLVVTAGHFLLIDPVEVPLGRSLHAAYDGLWELLDARDPITIEEQGRIRKRKLRAL